MPKNPDINSGKEMYSLATDLFPINRSITGMGVRKTLKIIQKYIPLKVFEVPSGKKVFDWKVPLEWNVKEAYVLDAKGKKIIDFKKNNLHLVGYSTPINATVSLSELQNHLYSLESQPNAIPYVTSYYKARWGFCLSHKQRQNLKEGNYRVVIKSSLKKGSLTYGELIIPGQSEKEILLSTNICHPSMANNELSGIVIATFLARRLKEKKRKYTYRIIFIPETIGSLVYLNKNLNIMKKNTVAGFVITCVGDNNNYSFVPSRYGNSLADRAALNVLKWKHPDFIHYSFLDRGSDERQYCSPGVDLPVVSIMRSKYGEYPEYHTSLDNLDFISPAGLNGAYDILKDCLEVLENNEKYKIKTLGEPQLGKRGLYPTLSNKHTKAEVKSMLNFITYADGTNDLIDVSNIINVPVKELYPIIASLKKSNLLEY